ncbi:MAG: winged helix-turn-helix domain-containing protein [Acidobacteria bacterium]|nr:winged helix-turn-helix domain-containing protein [Acidobacteriota bacterium]
MAEQSARYRFGVFEADPATGELRRKGIRVKLHAQPFQVLAMLLERPGELLTREDISQRLWPEGTFVDYEHGVNSAVNRIREALGDKASNPQFIETLARRGYRFIAPVERISDAAFAPSMEEAAPAAAGSPIEPPASSNPFSNGILATSDELPDAPHRVVKTLFILLQLMYVAFYVAALANLGEIGDLLSAYERGSALLAMVIVSAAVLIPVRAFLVTAMLFRAPAFAEKYRKLWPLLLVVDLLWALSPFLLMNHINVGVALACTALLVYSPFAQRSLMLMNMKSGHA